MPAPGQIQSLSSAPAMARMANGTYVPASMPSRALHGNHQKLLIVLQYFDGDKEAAEELALLIADLERVRNNQADIMVFRRYDAGEFSVGVLEKLRDKFNKVHYERGRRRDAKGYPFGPNQMWADLVTMIGQMPRWYENYYAFLPLESDCVPMRPGWINELIEEFRVAKTKNFAAVGHIHSNPVEHLNGVAVYDSHLWKIVPGNKLNGADPQVAYDIYHREQILPIAYNTPLVMMQYQRATITAEDLFKPWKDGFEPALFHGVKDGSARAAVRAKHITFSKEKDSSNVTVFTYEHQRVNNPSITAKYDLWSEGWRSRGWNPVKLTQRDAIRHPRYKEVLENVKALKSLGDPAEMVLRLVRWTALDAVGGGLMVDPEVMPNNFNPSHFNWKPAVLSAANSTGILAACMNRESLSVFLNAMQKYPADPENRLAAPELAVLKASGLFKKPNVMVSVSGEENWRSSKMVCFSQAEMQRIGARGTTLQLMEKFLRET
jgi:hypothetical protein